MKRSAGAVALEAEVVRILFGVFGRRDKELGARESEHDVGPRIEHIDASLEETLARTSRSTKPI